MLVLAQPESPAVIGQDLQRRAPTVAEHEQPARKRVRLQLLLVHPRQAINPVAEIHRFHRHQDAGLRGDLVMVS
ncbi:MAG: hypothetical protein ABSF71_40755 [Terriglobia bacterium]